MRTADGGVNRQRASPLHRARAAPWLLAVIGLAIPMIGGGFVGWPFAVGWLVVLGGVWVMGRHYPANRSEQMALALLALPVLVLLAWEGGWWLIPADLAWLAFAFAEGRAA